MRVELVPGLALTDACLGFRAMLVYPIVLLIARFDGAAITATRAIISGVAWALMVNLTRVIILTILFVWLPLDTWHTVHDVGGVIIHIAAMWTMIAWLH